MLLPCVAADLTLCIDPGTAHTGWAIYRGTVLVGCGATSFKKILSTLQQFLGPYPHVAHGVPVSVQLVIEVPKKYKYEEHPVDDLITLAFRAGVIAGIQHLTDLVVYDPHGWKGSTPKPVHHRRVLSVLTDDEKKLLVKQTKSARHRGTDVPKISLDMLDAIGLGLFHVKRMGRGVRLGVPNGLSSVGSRAQTATEDDQDGDSEGPE
jgi:hypothetical protein